MFAFLTNFDSIWHLRAYLQFIVLKIFIERTIVFSTKMVKNSIELEVCVDTVASALIAAEGGASRIELCSALSEGGLTPSIGTLKVLKKCIDIPIFCMLRPRGGNDFQFSDIEIEDVLYNMESFTAAGCDGFVFGALNEQKGINVGQCRKIIKKAGHLPVTFHRAFDYTQIEEIHQSLQIIKELKFQRVLTSGLRSTAEGGIDILQELVLKHGNDIIIMPGAGVNVMNLETILVNTKCKEVHSSARLVSTSKQVSNTTKNIKTTSSQETNLDIVRKMVSIIANLKYS